MAAAPASTSFTRYVDDGWLEIDNDAAERAPRDIAVGHKDGRFAGSDHGGHRAATIYSPIETVRRNPVGLESGLRETFARIAEHPRRRINQLLPWNCRHAA